MRRDGKMGYRRAVADAYYEGKLAHVEEWVLTGENPHGFDSLRRLARLARLLEATNEARR